MWLRQSTETTENLGPFLSNDTGTLALTNLTITPDLVLVGKNGGTMLGKANLGTASHNASGHYMIAIGSSDSDTLGRLDISIEAGTSLPVWGKFDVVPTDVYDALIGTNNLPTGTAENVLSIPAITGGTVDLAVQVNSLVTGTVGLAVQVNSGTIDHAAGANMTQINGGLTTGNNASLRLKTLNIENDAGDAIYAKSTGANGRGISAQGNGNSQGIFAWGGATNGDGFRALGQGSGKSINGTVDLAIQINSGTLDRVNSIPDSTGGTLDLVTNAGTLLQALSRAEPGQGAPAATLDSFAKLDYIQKAWRNKKTHDGTTFSLYNDAGDTVDQKSTDTASGSLVTSGEIITGA